MATAQTSLPALLDSLSQSLNSALETTPKLSGVIEPSKEGVSLLDVKNELLLSYLQNLVFLILLKIRRSRSSSSSSASKNALQPGPANKNGDEDGDEDEDAALSDTVVEKLVELRLYLEKGVRPLEDKLRFQLDKILRAADNADRSARQAEEAQAAAAGARKARDGAFDSGSEDSSSEEDEDEDEDDGAKPTHKDQSAKNFAPGTHGFVSAKKPVGMAAAAAAQDKTGVYRPPKITPTVMPTTEQQRRDRTERRQPTKSATMDEYVSHELSSAPVAQPSVGADIVRHGRGVKTAAQRADEDRRREYEETNFVRLPQESKKERAKRRAGSSGTAKMSFGGEEWRELGEGVDRIARLTGRKHGGGGGGTKALLEKSRKRARDTADSGRGSGLSSGTREIGDRFNKRVKVMEGGRRDRGKK